MVKDERNIIRETLELTKEKVNERIKAITSLHRSPMDYLPPAKRIPRNRPEPLSALDDHTQDAFDLVRRYRRREMGK